MAKPREIRITFKEKEAALYDYIQEKSSASAFLKDLAKLEKKKEEIFFNSLKASDTNNKILFSQKNGSMEYMEKEETLVLPDISDLED